MKQKKAIYLIVPLVVLALFAALLGTGLLDAAVADLELTWFTVDGGGGDSSGDDFALSGTAGQADAGRMSSTGNGFILHGGFWQVTGPASYEVYLPLVVK